jgi:hypothetical protein
VFGTAHCSRRSGSLLLRPRQRNRKRNFRAKSANQPGLAKPRDVARGPHDRSAGSVIEKFRRARGRGTLARCASRTIFARTDFCETNSTTPCL